VAKIQIMIVDDHEIVREGLKSLLELEDDVEEVLEASSSAECFSMLSECSPHVILMDLKMPGVNGIDTTRLIKNEYPQIKIIVLTNYDDEDFVIESIKAGADGYVLKDVKKGDLVKIIRKTLQGHVVVDSLVTRKLINRLKENDISWENTPPHPRLTHRELQILSCLVEGKSNREIANIIHLSLDTIKTHLKNTYRKLGVSSRSQAISIAIKEGFVHLSR